METNVERRTSLITVITGKVEGVHTLGDWEVAASALRQEGVSENAVQVYGGKAVFSTTIDNTGALRSLLDTLDRYLEGRLEEEERGGYDPVTERTLINSIRTIRAGL